MHSLLWGESETEGRGIERPDRRIRWTARYPVYDSASLSEGGEGEDIDVYRLSFFAIRRTLRRAVVESVTNFSTTTPSRRHRSARRVAVIDVEAATFIDDEPRIRDGTRNDRLENRLFYESCAERGFQDRVAFDPTPR